MRARAQRREARGPVVCSVQEGKGGRTSSLESSGAIVRLGLGAGFAFFFGFSLKSSSLLSSAACARGGA